MMILECFMGVLWIFGGHSWGFIGFCGVLMGPWRAIHACIGSSGSS